jgi:hypothetical protein
MTALSVHMHCNSLGTKTHSHLSRNMLAVHSQIILKSWTQADEKQQEPVTAPLLPAGRGRCPRGYGNADVFHSFKAICLACAGWLQPGPLMVWGRLDSCKSLHSGSFHLYLVPLQCRSPRSAFFCLRFSLAAHCLSPAPLPAVLSPKSCSVMLLLTSDWPGHPHPFDVFFYRCTDPPLRSGILLCIPFTISTLNFSACSLIPSGFRTRLWVSQSLHHSLLVGSLQSCFLRFV